MDRNFTALSLLILVVLVSGCTGGNSESGQETDKSVEIHSLSVNPTQVYSGTPINAELEIENIGKIDAQMDTGENGKKVLTDSCPDVFSIEEFSAVPQEYNLRDNIYKIDSDQGLTLRWRLNQEGDVPLYGRRCNLKFQIPFNYSVSGYRQIQVKSSRDVSGSSLNWESSSGPLTLAIESITGTGQEGEDTFIEGEDDKISALIQLQNEEKTEFNKGVTDIQEESMWIALTRSSGEVLFNETFKKQQTEECEYNTDFNIEVCSRTGDVKYVWQSVDGGTNTDGETHCEINSGQPLRITEGKSRVIKCSYDYQAEGTDFQDPSEILEFRSSVDYTYIKDAGSQEVEVETRG